MSDLPSERRAAAWGHGGNARFAEGRNIFPLLEKRCARQVAFERGGVGALLVGEKAFNESFPVAGKGCAVENDECLTFEAPTKG